MEQTVSLRKLDRVLVALNPAESGAPPELLEEFARRLLSRATDEFLEERPAGRTAADIQALFDLIERADPNEIRVRIRPVGDGPNRAVLETVMPDSAFIVNTLREALHARGCDIHQLLHPVLVLERDESGRILAVAGRKQEGFRTSVVYAAIDGHLDEEGRRELEEEVVGRLQQVLRATRDYRQMVARAREILEELELKKETSTWRADEFEEVRELLRWLEEDNFVFLGYRAYRFEADQKGSLWVQLEKGSSLGILQDEAQSRYYEPKAIEDLPADLRARVLGGPLLIISKTNAQSPIHRSVPMDYIGIKRVGPEGDVQGEHRFLGLFTFQALQQDASTIPILRRKLREILETEGAAKGSHDYDLIFQIFNSMPTEQLFLSSVPELSEVIETIMETQGADEVRVTAHADPLARGVNALVILPRHRYSDEVREKAQTALVEGYRGSVLNYHLAIGEGDQARLHFYIATELTEPGSVDLKAIESRVRESVRSWEERLSDALEGKHAAEKAHDLADRHVADFSAEYQAVTRVETAVEDIGLLEALEATGVEQVVLEEVAPERPAASCLKVFAPRGRFVLSDVMPTLENLGFRVIEADKYHIAEGERASTIHTFSVETPEEWGVDRQDAEGRVADALRAVQAGWTEDDALNALVLSARLDWRQVAVLRAYAGYAFRIGAVGSRTGAQRPLTEHPQAARLLYEIFEALLDPAGEEGRAARVRRLSGKFRDALRSVKSIEDDRTYRRFLTLLRATVRTNFFRRRTDGNPLAVALKFDCRRIEVMPEPRPRFEVYLNGPRTEAAHLRMGPVARGGIRWSDRFEDFRVEVLGLVKTQQVKNAVIVPEGSKGAFIVKRVPGDTRGAREAAVDSYREFIGTLLDLTDNVVDGEIRHPADTVVRDGEDPYLVVAADKGTAKLSDTANELAKERGFWLGDAFASGGSQGYDHKALGITARGVWESVKRHFWELGTDVEQEEFTVVGIGDMSGDVFGNGVLLSRKVKLIAAFDHRHIFVDPDPDAERSWHERQRLFQLAGSSWEDYDPKILSSGGAIFERGAKEIDLSPRARERLAIPDEEELNGDGLIRYILRAPVDLLWNGGIGTYIKASGEAQSEVSDPGNDAVRVDASEVRARVIGEGGNLGLTPRARVEYALQGGRLNTDALDNSAGVDTSDHEVNLKIFLNGALAAGLVDETGRLALLKEVTEDVAQAVLADNYTQSLAVSLDEHRVRQSPAEFQDALLILEREGRLDRILEVLPSTEVLLERQEAGAYLTRPELSVLLAYAKMHLKRRILASDLPDDPALMTLLRGYFPARLLEGIEEHAGGSSDDLLCAHRLRRHIVATVLTNRFVDRMGCTAHLQLARETGKDASEVARVWYMAGCIGQVDSLLETLRTTDHRVPAGVQYQWRLEISQALERATLWLLAKSDLEMSTSECVDWFQGPVAELRTLLPELLRAESGRELENRRALYETDGLDAEAAARLATFVRLDELLPVALLARETGIAARVAGGVYFGISDEIDFPWLQSQLAGLPRADLWVQRAAKTLSLQLELARASICRGILMRIGEEGTGGEAAAEPDVDRSLARFRRRHAADLHRIRQVIEDVRAEGRSQLAALMVAVHAIRTQGMGESGEK